ncbi:MAG: substrate-binding domain-containing protein [Phycisphaeraceae bacterium]
MLKTKSLTIGFLSQAWNLYCTPQFAGVANYIANHPNLILRDLRYIQNPQTPESLERGRPPWTGLVDGVITGEGVERDPKETADWMLRGGVPVINLGADLRDPRIPYVHTSYDSIGKLAVEHFLAIGLTSFAVIGFVRSYASPLRREAFDAALRKRKYSALSYDMKARLEGLGDETTLERREKGLIRLLKTAPKPLGVLAINDTVGRAVCRLADDLGFAVPDEVAVLGVGNSELSWTRSPSLSSICTPGENIAFTAARTLHQILLGKPAPAEAVQIPAMEVIARQSTLARAPYHREVERAIDFIRRHACNGINVEQVMQTITMSRRLFEQLFTKEIGRSPGREIQRLRLERAEQLLKETELSISQIAQMIGFCETAAFSKFFKKHTGDSPGQRRTAKAGA